jgi:Pyridine nucleotide-disulphide oxidoreductase
MLEAAVIGAGPYGLSVAAHLRRQGVPFRIFGRAMDSWIAHMPKGMRLKSDGFASNIHDPDGMFILQHFCAQRGIEYADVGAPVRLETFAEYGLAFGKRMVPDLEEQMVTHVGHRSGKFEIEIESGETFAAKRVILAVGITHFAHVPPELRGLSREFVSHSFQHSNLRPFRGRSVVVVGAGASAIDLAGLLNECGTDVQLVARARDLEFHERAITGKPRSHWQQLRSPLSGLGPGLRSRFYADAPNLFWHLPERKRLEIAGTFLGPAGGWFSREGVVGKVPLLLGWRIKRAQVTGGLIGLQLLSTDSSVKEIQAQHVIAATGYRVDLERLTFIAPEILRGIKAVRSTPILSSAFESTWPGLYFVGPTAANSFGPVMRFVYGSKFAARRLSQTILKGAIRGRAWVSVPQMETLTNEGTPARPEDLES